MTPVISLVAGDEVLRREHRCILAQNAEVVGKRLGCTERPAGTALGLIPDRLLAAGPLGTGVKCCRDAPSLGLALAIGTFSVSPMRPTMSLRGMFAN